VDTQGRCMGWVGWVAPIDACTGQAGAADGMVIPLIRRMHDLAWLGGMPAAPPAEPQTARPCWS
jgi:hypothetical protein